ncbi:hypothetical protein [Nocardia sp. NBC_01327]|uniref:hypothetical protein n=1 Tax=Nocardia sp. NBC_01327 TaxID=2903593 RepID=UPI002E123B51|nr:hypothetical protein OG326_12320 [Nocardia sp. NBC_01327]
MVTESVRATTDIGDERPPAPPAVSDHGDTARPRPPLSGAAAAAGVIQLWPS